MGRCERKEQTWQLIYDVQIVEITSAKMSRIPQKRTVGIAVVVFQTDVDTRMTTIKMTMSSGRHGVIETWPVISLG